MEEITKYSLEELRARKRKTQVEVAKEVNVSVTTYAKWEKKPGNIRISKFCELAQYFCVNITEIKIGG